MFPLMTLVLNSLYICVYLNVYQSTLNISLDLIGRTMVNLGPTLYNRKTEAMCGSTRNQPRPYSLQQEDRSDVVQQGINLGPTLYNRKTEAMCGSTRNHHNGNSMLMGNQSICPKKSNIWESYLIKT